MQSLKSFGLMPTSLTRSFDLFICYPWRYLVPSFFSGLLIRPLSDLVPQEGFEEWKRFLGGFMGANLTVLAMTEESRLSAISYMVGAVGIEPTTSPV
jgi:hypothetical protein